MDIVIIHSFDKDSVSIKLYKKTLPILFNINKRNIINIKKVLESKDKDINNIKTIISLTIKDIYELRQRYTGKLVGINVPVSNPFDYVFTTNIEILRNSKDFWYFNRWIPHPYLLFDILSPRSDNKKVGFILSKTKKEDISKVIRVIEDLVDLGYSTVGYKIIEEEDILLNIQKRCPVFMFHHRPLKISKLFSELSSCCHIITNTDEGIYLSMILNKPIIFLNKDNIFRFPYIKKSCKVRKLLEKASSRVEKNKEYLIQSRLILGMLKEGWYLPILESDYLPSFYESYFFIDPIIYKELDSSYKEYLSFIEKYNNLHGYLLNPDVVSTFIRGIKGVCGQPYLINWIGIIPLSEPQIIESLLENYAFRVSLKTCRCLYVFNREGLDSLKKKVLIKILSGNQNLEEFGLEILS